MCDSDQMRIETIIAKFVAAKNRGDHSVTIDPRDAPTEIIDLAEALHAHDLSASIIRVRDFDTDQIKMWTVTWN